MRSLLPILGIGVATGLFAAGFWCRSDSTEWFCVTPGALRASIAVREPTAMESPSRSCGAGSRAECTPTESNATVAVLDDELARFAARLNSSERARIADQGETVADYQAYCRKQSEIRAYGAQSVAWQFAQTGAKLGALGVDEMWTRIQTHALVPEVQIAPEVRTAASEVMRGFQAHFLDRYRSLRESFALQLPASYRFRDMMPYLEREQSFWIALDEQTACSNRSAERALVGLLGESREQRGYLSLATLGKPEPAQ